LFAAMAVMLSQVLRAVPALGKDLNTFRRRHGVLTDPHGSVGGTHQNRNPEDKAMTSDEDFSQLDDPAFLAERKRVREELERTPAVSEEMAARYQRLTDEFIRRARAAWAPAS
jgi:hypothetical protein